MKLFVIGDFHGKFPKKLQNRIKKENPDLVVSLGDYFPWELRDEFFKCCYRTDKELWEVVGKKKYKEADNKDFKIGRKIIECLDKLPFRIISITGNHDYTKWKEAHIRYDKREKIKWKYPNQERFSKIQKKLKNMKIFDWSYVRVNDFVFIGYPNSNFPGMVKSRQYRIQKKKLDILFKKFSKENKEGKVIFVTHNVPYGSKLGVVRAKDAHKKAKGKNYGSKLAGRAVNRYQPRLVLCGHLHENPGKDKLGKTLIVNPGPAYEGKAAIINIDESKGKVKSVKFLS